VRGQTVTAAEAATLAPVCRLILIEKPNAHIDHIAQKKNAALFDRPEYRMAKNAIHLHHWCRAAVTRHRYFTASSPQKKRGYKSDFHDEMDYVIRNMGPAWPYTPLLLAEKGEMFLLDKKYPEASSQALNAVQLNPAFARAHILLVNVYNAMGQKDKALEAATAGIRHNPGSATLKRMYDEMGGAKPYPEPVAKPAIQEPQPEASMELPPPSSGEFKAAGEAEAVTYPLRPPEAADAPPDAATAEPPPGQKKYCRFCP
jgi:tetratricopeptide (TPR) repeat protein